MLMQLWNTDFLRLTFRDIANKLCKLPTGYYLAWIQLHDNCNNVTPLAACNSCKMCMPTRAWNTLAAQASLVLLYSASSGWCLFLKNLFTGRGRWNSKTDLKKKIWPCWHAQLDMILPLGSVCPYVEPLLLATLGWTEVGHFWDWTLLPF